ncbi:MAG: Dabb family protein [Bacteroidota bacterium]
MKKSILLLTVLLGLFHFSCHNQNPLVSDDHKDIHFIHTVFFWLNDTVTDVERIAFESGLEILGTIPVIEKFYYGKPAGTSREVVDNSYDYAWIVHFADAGAQDKYQEHEIHLEFVDKYQHLWEHVKVYDTVLEE